MLNKRLWILLFCLFVTACKQKPENLPTESTGASSASSDTPSNWQSAKYVLDVSAIPPGNPFDCTFNPDWSGFKQTHNGKEFITFAVSNHTAYGMKPSDLLIDKAESTPSTITTIAVFDQSNAIVRQGLLKFFKVSSCSREISDNPLFNESDECFIELTKQGVFVRAATNTKLNKTVVTCEIDHTVWAGDGHDPSPFIPDGAVLTHVDKDTYDRQNESFATGQYIASSDDGDQISE